ncbi:hypothetical protein GCM10025858_03460 [Alicyclobacillus sacchari]|nr:hypothetical protein GCM10025858_03460 [Alicyclobacillus sacchari]
MSPPLSTPLFAERNGIGDKHGHRHRPDPTWNRRNGTNKGRHLLEVDIAKQTAIDAVHADIDDDRCYLTCSLPIRCGTPAATTRTSACLV